MVKKVTSESDSDLKITEVNGESTISQSDATSMKSKGSLFGDPIVIVE